MTSVMKIPDKTMEITVSTVSQLIDTKGLMCSMKIVGGEAAVTAGNSTAVYPVSDGEILEFCGEINVKLTSGTPKAHIILYRTI